MRTVTIAHLSDLHVSSAPGDLLFGRRATETLDSVLAALASTTVDAALVTGDLADTGDAASITYVANRMKTMDVAVRWLAGNHDFPHVLEEVAPGWTRDLTIGSWTIVPVQSFVKGEWFGRITDEEYERIEQAIDAAPSPYIALAMHQPVVGICAAPGCVLEDPARFFTFLDAHPKVRTVISGHQHRSFNHQLGDVLLIGGGSTCVQMDHVGDGLEKRPDPPMANLITLRDDGGVEVVPVLADYADAPGSHT